jgi:hypothetical protein
MTHAHGPFCKCVSRRNLFSLAIGGLAGLALLPRQALAKGKADALVLNCMDYRLVDEGVQYFNARGLRNNYDQVILAGASVGALGKIGPEWAATFWKHVETAKALHHIECLIVIDHRDCGAYKIVFGPDSITDRDMETALHRSQMILLRQELAQRHPDLRFEGGLMSLNGAVENLFPGDGARVDYRPKPKAKPKPPAEQTAAAPSDKQAAAAPQAPAPAQTTTSAAPDPHAAHGPAPAPQAAPAAKPAPVSASGNVPIETAAPPPPKAAAPAHSPAQPAAVGSSAHGGGHGH